MRNPKFGYVFSFLLGVGLIVIVMHRDCTGADSLGQSAKSCRVAKAPAPAEVMAATYIIDSDCYKFKTAQIACPSGGDVVESFRAPLPLGPRRPAPLTVG
jgi:hypothetical protein